MRRILLIVGGVVLVVVLAAGAAIGAAFVGRKPVVTGQVVEGLQVVQDGIVSATIVTLGDGKAALIDAGNDPGGVAILEALQSRGLGPDDVLAIFLTHGHADHTGAVLKFPRARVVSLATEVPIVEGREGSKGPLLRLMPVSPTGIAVTDALQDGETVTIEDVPVRVFAVPGHTAGSAAYLVRGVLFVGDSADANTDGTLRPAPWIFSDSQAQNRASLVALSQRLQRDGVTVTAIVPAHSAAMTDGQARLDAFARAQVK